MKYDIIGYDKAKNLMVLEAKDNLKKNNLSTSLIFTDDI